MLSYGLTGGMGSGKSTVGRMIREAGLPVFDADAMGRELIQDDPAVIAAILWRFPTCTLANGAIDRSALAGIVFASSDDRLWLEDLLHPRILDQYLRRAQATGAPLCLIEGAVLIESRTRFDLDGLIVVTAPQQVRLARLKKRDDLSTEELLARMKAQLPEEQKIAQATHLIDNGGSLEQTRAQVDLLVKKLRTKSGGQP